MQDKQVIAIDTTVAAPRTQPSNYPESYASMMQGRVKRPLGDLFGLTKFDVNLTTLGPGSVSALRHEHSKQDEFICIVSGQPTLHADVGETPLMPGSCAGFTAGGCDVHRLVNTTDEEVVYL